HAGGKEAGATADSAYRRLRRAALQAETRRAAGSRFGADAGQRTQAEGPGGSIRHTEYRVGSAQREASFEQGTHPPAERSLPHLVGRLTRVNDRSRRKPFRARGNRLSRP